MCPIQRELLPSERVIETEERLEIDMYFRLRGMCFDLSKQLRQSLSSLRHIQEQKQSLKREFDAIVRSSYLIRAALTALSILPAPGKSVAMSILLFKGFNIRLKRKEFEELKTDQISALEKMYENENENVDRLLCTIEAILNICREEAQEIFFEFGVDSWMQDEKFVTFDFRENIDNPCDLCECMDDTGENVQNDHIIFTSSSLGTDTEQTPAKLYLGD